MTDEMAKKQLRRMLKSFTSGSVLHLLGEVFEDMAGRAAQGNEARHEQYRAVASTLFVVGLGIDAVCPR